VNAVFGSFLKGGYAYNFANGPDVITTEAEAAQSGLNCIALIHLLIRRLYDMRLPGNVKGWEMYCDNPYFTQIPSLDDAKLGDVLFCGRQELPAYALAYHPTYNDQRELTNQEVGDKLIGQQYAGIHLAMYTGDKDDAGSPLLIHANKLEGTVAIWPLAKFTSLEQYATIHAVKRVIR